MTSADRNSTTSLVPVTGASETSTFHFENHAIRVVHRDGKAWFVGQDVCDALKLSNPSASVAALDEDERSKLNLDRRVGLQIVVSESGLYTLILRNRGAVIEGTVSHRFRRWVTGEVLPKIRQTGAYAPNLDDPATLRRLLLGKMDRIDALEAQVEEKTNALAVAHEVIEQDSPKIEAYDMLLSDSGTLCLADAARHIGPSKRISSGGSVAPTWCSRRMATSTPSPSTASMAVRPEAVPAAQWQLPAQTRVTRQGLVWLTHRWKAHQMVVAREAERARIQANSASKIAARKE